MKYQQQNPTTRIGASTYAPENVFIPEVLIPEQFSPSIELSGERRLAFIVVQDALEIALGKRITPIDLRAKTSAWIASDSEATMSFLWWCGLLELDPGYLRALVAKHRIERAKRSSRRGITGAAWRNLETGWR